MKIKLYPRTERHMEQMDRSASQFMSDFMRANRSRTLDQGAFDTLKQLGATAFWRVLKAVDGDDVAREKAQRMFKPYELVDLLSICVNQAITFPRATIWPGSLNGNTILYRHFSNSESLVRKYAPEQGDFETILQNGRLWESLADMREGISTTDAWNIAAEVLTKHFDRLDTSFVSHGLEIIARQDATYGFPQEAPALSLYSLDSSAVPKYGDFFLQADALPSSKLGIPKKDFRERFFTPYVKRVLKRDEDGIPEFPSYKSPSAFSLLANEPSKEVLDNHPKLKKSYNQIIKE